MNKGGITAITIFTAMILMSHVTISQASERGRRSDDSDPMEAVVNGLTQKLDQLTAQLEAQNTMIQDKDAQRVSQEAEFRAEINDLKSKVAVLEQPVAFTAVFTTSDIHGLGVGQILKFDRVLYNVGNGYDPTTGYFTAPSAGTYAFYNRVMVHAAPGDLIQTAMYKGNILLAYADACCHAEDSGTTMVTMHLSKGETVHIQVHSGNRFWGDHTIFTGFKLAPV